MIDTGLTGGVSAPSISVDYKELGPAEVEAPARSCIIDIECEDERGFPDPQRDAIIAITAYDSFPGDYTTFLLVGGGTPATIAEKQAAGGLVNGCFKKAFHTICTYGDETEMLRAFVRYITERDPDVLSGWNFVEFDMPKFRTMCVDAEKGTGAILAQKGDPRVTRVGRFLRNTSLDELPQLVNVLKGDMSLVGPRPERPEFVREFRQRIPGYMQKHLVKAGITGWAQVNDLRGDTDIEQRIQYDLYYIDNWSLWFDLRILALTLWHILTSRHAH